MHSTFKSFTYAIQGVKDALISEPNLRFHFMASMLAILVAIYLKFNSYEFSILILTIFFVFTLELVNTIIEKLVDMHSKEITEEARIIKDISAGVVLLGAIASLFIACFLFISKLF